MFARRELSLTHKQNVTNMFYRNAAAPIVTAGGGVGFLQSGSGKTKPQAPPKEEDREEVAPIIPPSKKSKNEEGTGGEPVPPTFQNGGDNLIPPSFVEGGGAPGSLVPPTFNGGSTLELSRGLPSQGELGRFLGSEGGVVSLESGATVFPPLPTTTTGRLRPAFDRERMINEATPDPEALAAILPKSRAVKSLADLGVRSPESHMLPEGYFDNLLKKPKGVSNIQAGYQTSTEAGLAGDETFSGLPSLVPASLPSLVPADAPTIESAPVAEGAEGAEGLDLLLA